MMFGNVAPAPLSCTCAAAGAAAQSSAARAMARVVFTGSSSVWVDLEHELRLDQEPIRGRRPGALILVAIEVGEQTDVRGQLVRRAGDDPHVAIVGGVVVRINDVHACDDGDLAGRGQVIDAEGADDAPGRGGGGDEVLHRYVLACHRELRRPVGELAQKAVAVDAAVKLADADVSGGPEATHAAVVVGRTQPDGNAGLEILVEIAGAVRVPLAIHNRDLRVYLLTVPMAVDTEPDVRRCHDTVTVDRDRALHAVIPQRLLIIDEGGLDHAELVGEAAAGGGPRREGVLEPDELVAAGAGKDVARDASGDAVREPT